MHALCLQNNCCLDKALAMLRVGALQLAFSARLSIDICLRELPLN
jgi:hypothetical protein